MSHSNSSETTDNYIALTEFVTHVERYFDSVVERGSDQELFTSSYLSGHFSLALSRVERTVDVSVAHLQSHLLDSLHQAFNDNELVPTEQILVLEMWKKLTDTEF